jgi:hypothetical protein
MKIPLLLCIFSATTACARTWTDAQGRMIEAEIVRVEEGDPVVKKGAQEIKLTFAKLSTAD